MPTSIALLGPGSETNAGVTVTQQSAFCPAGRTSRRAQPVLPKNRRVEDWIPPFLIASFGSVLKICRNGITPNSIPASTEISNAIRIKDGCGCIWNLKGYSVGGGQFCRPVCEI